jgi:hypothetical protein
VLSLVHLTLANLLHGTLLIDMDVEALGPVVHRAHAVGLEDAVFLGEVGLCERLVRIASASIQHEHASACLGQDPGR